MTGPSEQDEADAAEWAREQDEAAAARARELEEAVARLWAEVERLVLPIIYWLDRQLQRMPRLYRWLSQ